MIPCSWRMGIVTPKVTCLIKTQQASSLAWGRSRTWNSKDNPKAVCGQHMNSSGLQQNKQNKDALPKPFEGSYSLSESSSSHLPCILSKGLGLMMLRRILLYLNTKFHVSHWYSMVALIRDPPPFHILLRVIPWFDGISIWGYSCDLLVFYI